MWARLTRLGALLLVATALHPLAAAAANAVSRHPDLPAAVTVWCLANPERFGVAARAFGMETGEESDPKAFIRGGKGIFLSEWATSDEEGDIDDFDRACRTAFIAFRHAGVGLALYGLEPGQLAEALEGDSSSGDDLLSGAGGVVIGAVLTGLGGAVAGRRRAHQDDAEELRRFDAEFQSALELHVVDPTNVDAARQARVRARVLRDAVREWTPRGLAQVMPKGLDEKEVRDAEGLLGELLDGGPPRIGSLRHGTADELEEDANTLLSKAARLHVHVAKVADQVSKVLRGAEREPQDAPDVGADS
jgi:hypothetical protein